MTCYAPPLAEFPVKICYASLRGELGPEPETGPTYIDLRYINPFM